MDHADSSPRDVRGLRPRIKGAKTALLLGAALTSALLLAPPAQALSTGCTLANDPGFDATLTGGSLAGFAFEAGEMLTITGAAPASGTTATSIRLLVGPTQATQIQVDSDSLPGTLQYTIPTSGTYYVSWQGVPTGETALVNWTVTCTAAATAVTFRSLSASATASGVVIRWSTASELHTIGFNVYREVNGRRVRVSKRLIAARGANGGAYSFLDRRAPRGKTIRYWIQEVAFDGSRSWYGPARVRRS